MRPHTLADVARLSSGNDNYPSYMKEFLDEFRNTRKSGDGMDILDCISEEPQMTGSPVSDVHLAGMAEYIASLYFLPCPAWADGAGRTLAEPVFFGGRHSRAMLLATTTFSMRRRNLFCGKVEL